MSELREFYRVARGVTAPQWTVSELDFLQGRGTDGSIMGSNIIDACLLNIVGDGLQDLQDLGTVGTTTEQGQSEGRGHDRLKG